jgi:hypothetical protein
LRRRTVPLLKKRTVFYLALTLLVLTLLGGVLVVASYYWILMSTPQYEEVAEEAPAATSESTSMETSTSTTSTATDITTGDEIPPGENKGSSACVPPFTSLHDMLECAKMDLKPGRLAFEPRKTMDQGREEKVFVRLSREAASDISKGFQEAPPMIKAIQVGSVMRAALDYSPEDFKVRRVGEETKTIESPYTEWAWKVTPLLGGDKQLNVLVYAELVLPNGNHELYEAFIGSAVIHVHTRPSYVVGKFVRENWQWLLGSPIVLGLGGWLGVRLLKSKKRPAGFVVPDGEERDK